MNRRIEGGICWIWYVTDTEEDAIQWYKEMFNEEPGYNVVCNLPEGKGWGFRVHR